MRLAINALMFVSTLLVPYIVKLQAVCCCGREDGQGAAGGPQSSTPHEQSCVVLVKLVTITGLLPAGFGMCAHL